MSDPKVRALNAIKELLLKEGNFSALQGRVWVETIDFESISPHTYPFALISYELGIPNQFAPASLATALNYSWNAQVFIAFANGKHVEWPSKQFASLQNQASPYVGYFRQFIAGNHSNLNGTVSVVGTNTTLFTEEFTPWEWTGVPLWGLLFTVPILQLVY